MPQPRPAPFAEISLEYLDTPAQAAGNVASWWQADLAPIRGAYCKVLAGMRSG